ncbi:MAG: prepilin-type N-terminal cleavage/methylation domain-containing protein [Phycisphaerales bacterium JB039]
MMRCALSRGLTLIETVASLAIISVLGLAALRALGAAALSRALAEDRARAATLAHDLLEEILAKPYGLPPAVAPTDPTRLAFDDIGDYHGWSASPPVAPDGATLAPAPWRREATVQPVQTSDPAALQAGSRLAVITVRIFKGERLMETRTAMRSAAWDVATGAAP